MSDEPKRVGLTGVTASQLDELLEHMNPEAGEEGVRLIKIDLYNLAVALGIKNAVNPPYLSDKSNTVFRVNELDPDKVLFTVIETSNALLPNTSIYSYIERLAEHGINEFYKAYQLTGELPLESYFND